MSGVPPHFADWLVGTAVDAALLTGALLLVDRLLGARLGPTTRYLLWSLVLVRLLLPALPTDPLGLKTAAAPPATRTDAEAEPFVVTRDPSAGVPARQRPRGAADTEPAVAAEVEGAPSAAAAPPPAAEPELRGTTRATQPVVQRNPLPLPAGAPDAPMPAATADAAATPQPAFPWRPLLLGLWAAGALLLVLRLSVLEIRFRRRLARDRGEAPARLVAALEEARRNVGLRRPVRAVLTDAVPAPAVSGLLRPRLLMPPAALARLDDAELRHVLAHEVEHLRAGDPWFRWLLALAGALHWYHPLARVALRRVQEAQEVLRDYQALGRTPGADPGGYAGTLLKLGTPPPKPQPVPLSALLEDGKSLKRRIQMIVDFPLRRRNALLGTLLVAAAGWGGLTAAATVAADPDRAAGDPPTAHAADPDQEPRSIRVVRRDPQPAWKTKMLEALSQPLALKGEVTLGEIAEAIREGAGLNVVIDQDMDLDDELVVHLPGRSAAQLLDQLREIHGMNWGLTPGAVYIDWGSASTYDYDLRFYAVRELLAQGGEIGEEVGRLEDLIFTLAQPDWEGEYESFRYFNGLLVINQTERGHRQVQHILDLLLNRGAVPAPQPSAARAALEAKLALRQDVDFDVVEWRDVVDQLSQATGVPIYLGLEQDDGRVVTLKLQGLSLREVLEWVARQTWTVLVVEDDMVRFSDTPPTEVRAYEVSDLLGGDQEESADQLVDLVYSTVGWQSWDVQYTSTHVWHGLLVVRQTPAVHDNIRAFLDALRAAL